MDRSEEIGSARRYLAENAKLRQSVGALDGDVLEPCFLGEGEHNLNYSFYVPSNGKRFVLRVNVLPQPFHDNQVAYEFSALELLDSCGRVPHPVYLDDTPEAPGEGAMVESFCEGRQLDFDNLQPGDLEKCAQLMADFHAVRVNLGGAKSGKAGTSCSLYRPAEPLRALYDECVERYELYLGSEYADDRVTRWMEVIAGEARRVLDTDFFPEFSMHVVNTEPVPSHFLLSDELAPSSGSAISGGADFAADSLKTSPGYFVDWERPLIGEVAQDVAYFVSPTTTFWDSSFTFPASEVEGFLDIYRRAVNGRFALGNFEERMRAYRVMTVFRSQAWCCKALIRYSEAERKGLHVTGKTAEKLPIYLSDGFMEMVIEECLA